MFCTCVLSVHLLITNTIIASLLAISCSYIVQSLAITSSGLSNSGNDYYMIALVVVTVFHAVVMPNLKSCGLRGFLLCSASDKLELQTTGTAKSYVVVAMNYSKIDIYNYQNYHNSYSVCKRPYCSYIIPYTWVIRHMHAPNTLSGKKYVHK